LEGAAGDYAVFTIQSCILNRMSFLEVTEPRCAADDLQVHSCEWVRGYFLVSRPLARIFVPQERLLDMCDRPVFLASSL